ncbi:hypothetical protein [Schinkia azotoformans]|uniref:hypothetical protein n=1 Tax=Schinkia azotoformans TaxID=1454 RepID=UPI002DBD1D2E|nr:hypothetical protein [Schinkia azotoformans]MEC1744148.1 hypothetical protein [Schinkia azotoformans]
MLLNQARYRVLLPNKVTNKDNQTDLIQAAKEYMERYPHYQFLFVEGAYAICERKQMKELEKQ